jgi:hypothetical protein
VTAAGIASIAIVAGGIRDRYDLASRDQRLLHRKIRTPSDKCQDDEISTVVNGHRRDLPKYQVSEIKVTYIFILRILPVRALTCFAEDLGD